MNASETLKSFTIIITPRNKHIQSILHVNKPREFILHSLPLTTTDHSPAFTLSHQLASLAVRQLAALAVAVALTAWTAHGSWQPSSPPAWQPAAQH